MMETPVSLTEIVERQRRAEEHLDRARSDYFRLAKNLRQEIEDIKRLRKLDADGLDIARVQVAEKWLAVEGWCDSELRREVVEDAIRELAADGLRESWLGVKIYAHFGEQRVRVSYGYLPDHGQVVFRVGFHEVWIRGYSGIDPDRELTPEEIDACIYYLEAVKDRRVFGRGRS